MSSKKIIIVIPVYTTNLSYIERNTLKNNVDKLKDYDITIISPQSLDISGIADLQNDNISMARFGNDCFSSVEGYNKLLRSSAFYSGFSEYEYLLILQLDAFIFHNDLDVFCNKDYDYWGAPWIDFELINYKFLRTVLPLFHKSRYLRPFRNIFGKKYLVGNGGLSLRKVATHLQITTKFASHIQEFEKDYNKWIEGGATSMMEDVFWTLFVPRFYPEYKVAPWKEAINFSFEMSPRKAYTLNGNKLPFGCHAFAKVDPDFYKKFISFLK
jgi:hypothetical protein